MLHFLYPPEGTRNYEDGCKVRELVERFAPEVVAEKAEDAQMLVPIGGDGAVLHAVHGNYGCGKPFFGIHMGTKGFLLNHVPVDNPARFIQMLKQLDGEDSVDLVECPLIAAEIDDIEGRTHKMIAFNDVYLNADPGTIAIFRIWGEFYPLREFMGDGVIVATPQGSTGYNFKAGGNILSLGEKVWVVKENNSGRFGSDTIVEQELVIEVVRDWAYAIADTKTNRFKARRVVIRPSGIVVKIAFLKGTNFQIRRYGTRVEIQF